MLRERVFSIGGWLCIGFGASLLAVSVVFGIVEVAWGVLVTPLLLVGFGSFFVYVGREAKRDRLDLLALPKPVDPDASRTDPGRGPG
ncbi:MAG: hypothetical protein WA761_10650 [Thermoplasmata archaeon]